VELESLVLLENDQLLIQSDAVLGIVRHLRGLWRVALIARLFPKIWRDWCYDLFAQNRKRWFPSKPSCLFLSDNLQDRFLD